MDIRSQVTGLELDVLREALKSYEGNLTDNACRYRGHEGPSPRVEEMEQKAKAAKALLRKLT